MFCKLDRNNKSRREAKEVTRDRTGRSEDQLRSKRHDSLMSFHVPLVDCTRTSRDWTVRPGDID
jgi:hypothetical protein